MYSGYLVPSKFMAFATSVGSVTGCAWAAIERPVIAIGSETSWSRPTAHILTRSKQPWVVLPDGDRQFETQPDDIAGFLGGAGPSAG